MKAVLEIVAALLPLVLAWVRARKDDSYADKQTLRAALHNGDLDTISYELDRLREKARRRSTSGQQ